jgi:hypothetical protein
MRVFVGPLAWRPSFGAAGFAWGAPVPGVKVLDFRPLAECGTAGPAAQTSAVLIAPDAIDLAAIDPAYEQIASDPDETLDLARRQQLKALTGSTAALTALRLRNVLYELLTEHADPAQVRTTGTILPTRDRRLTLHCGPLALEKDFDFLGPEWPNVRDTIRAQYRQFRDEALAGLREAFFHRRFLMVLLEKFRLSATGEILRRFIPDDLDLEDPLPHHTAHSDNFNVSNNSNLSGQLTWTETSSTSHWETSSSQARAILGAADLDARAEHDVSSNDHRTQLTGVETGIYWGVCVRFASAARTYMLGYRGYGETNSAIAKVVGTRTELTTDATSSSANDVISLECSGTIHTLKINGAVQLGPHSDSSIPTGTRGGIFGFLISGLPGADDFLTEDMLVQAAPYGMVRTYRPAAFAPGFGR